MVGAPSDMAVDTARGAARTDAPADAADGVLPGDVGAQAAAREVTAAASPPGPAGSPGSPGSPDNAPLSRELLLTALVVVLGSAMAGLDTTAVTVSLDRLSQDFGTPLTTVQWVATGYTLALAAVIPVTAWAIARFGTRRVYAASVGLFLAGSVLAGLAWSVESLIVFRVVQGLGGGMIMPTGMTILGRRAGERTPRVMAIVGIPMQLAPMSGPLLGGWLVDAASWRWIFYLNLPLGIAALVVAARVLGRDEPGPYQPLDRVGLVLLSPGLAALVYGLTTGAHRGDFTAPGAAVPAATGLLLVAAFVAHALNHDAPLIDLRLLRRRAVGAAAAALALFISAFFGVMLLAPLYFQTVRGESAAATGALLLPSGLGAMVTMPVGARLLGRFGPRNIVLTGLGLSAAGLTGFAAQIGAHPSYPGLCAALFVSGAGMGMTMMPTMSSAMSVLELSEVPVASTLLNIVQQVGAAAGTAFMSLVLSSALAERDPADAAGAFQHSYVWGVALLAAAFLPAALLSRAPLGRR
ncbi:DHA2 family efflux MFS transporter permease subunit [Yinghuangia seranimata]|uniref:DHA2 family efflux MFS transporter permease subunit n=1 Tax=Yinghuangia seranimata TaxID=408067 RepID=UPI00248C2DF5|nr:DHA2 family efflux MFS transporter permease subunit [Yinghuangia seranimata]MDI2129254.1 DHA2 family efflux MFS transporter permease subunit [Yinghuangia seranimata]